MWRFGHAFTVRSGHVILEIGNKAPDFTLQTDEGNQFTLSKYTGKKVVLYFYPKDLTPGCTQEACDFRDHWQAFKNKNVEIVGISKDSTKTHVKFKNKYKLPFTLLVDEEGNVGEKYGVINKKKFVG